MSPLEPLAPDQRAVVSLVLQQGRSYDEIAALLGIPVDAVRARAQAGLAALAPANGLPGEITAPLADYLLGQQPDADAEATRGLLAESAPARAWATGVAGRLAGVAKAPLPEIPGADAAPALDATAAPDAVPALDATAAPVPDASADAPPTADDASAAAARAAASSASPTAAASAAAEAPPPGPRPRPMRQTGGDAPPPASKLGGVLLIAAVIAVVGVVLFLVLRGGDEEEPATAGNPTATATPTPTAEPQVADQIRLRAAGGGNAKGTMTVFLQGDRLLFALQGENLPPSSRNSAYAVWFTGPGDKARRLGFTNPVGEDGKLGIQGPSEKDVADFPKLYATYANVVVSQESSEDAKRPTRIVLTGKLPQGR
jgi:Anti-sigma-K factor rskA/Sigma-70, region 4